jgi:hypothetical protein
MEHITQLLRQHIPDIPEQQLSTHKPFIESNTSETHLADIRQNHIIPVYAKDNERLISIAEFIDTFTNTLHSVYPDEIILQPSIRVSHPIKGRIPSAKDKEADELQDWEKTLYYERAAFVIEIPSIQTVIDGNTLTLTAGGVKSYHLDKLQGKKGSDEHFSFFIGFQNKVCTNLCIWTDGYSQRIGVKSKDQLTLSIYQLLENYNSSHHLHHLRCLEDESLSEQQFAQLIGRCRMYPHLPPSIRNKIPQLCFGDSQLNQIVKDYYKDENFCRDENGQINLWRLYNLFTGSNKSSYIDSFAERSVNAYHFVETIRWALEREQDHWFLQ